MQHYIDLIAKFNDTRVMVVGDIYLDENVFGLVTGISLEAPIPIYEVQEKRHNPGAAGNAACNVAALGAMTYMVGVVGDDVNAGIVRREFAVRNVDTTYVVTDPDRATNTYGKLRAGTFNAPSQEILRTDTPKPVYLSGAVEEALIENIRALAPKVQAIAVVDQVCSVCTDRVLAEVVAIAKKHKLLTVGDSRNRAGAFKGFDVVVPNDREAGIGTGIDVVDAATLDQAGRALVKICRNALVTRGPEGISIFAEDGSRTDVPITPVTAVDVTGAGDTVTATVTVTLAAGGTLHDAATLGNKTAGIAVQQQGVVTVPQAQLIDALAHGGRPAKLKSRDELAKILRDLQARGKRVVWTNGCFDLLHAGHITYLHDASLLGDVLVIGLNSDASVQGVKGFRRPVVNEEHRALLLAELECVDYITLFSEQTTAPLLEQLKPDIYAKGGDYTVDTINQEERRLVEGYGGTIKILRGVEGQSTTELIERIKAIEKMAEKG